MSNQNKMPKLIEAIGILLAGIGTLLTGIADIIKSLSK